MASGYSSIGWGQILAEKSNASPVEGVELRLTLGGYLFEIKQHPDGLRTALVKVDAQRPMTKACCSVTTISPMWPRENAAHYCMDYRNFDGFVFPTRRRVVSRGENEITATGGPSSVLIDIETVVVSRA
jgi:hypothetical protein